MPERITTAPPHLDEPAQQAPSVSTASPGDVTGGTLSAPENHHPGVFENGECDHQPDLQPATGQRFDLPSSVQLETWGADEYAPDRNWVAHRPQVQPEFWTQQTTWKNTVAAKLRTAGRPDLAAKLEKCHSEWTVALCLDCGRRQRFPNRCDNWFCSECQPRLAHERCESIAWWATEITQPKHLVLTISNIPDLTRGHVEEFKRWWKRLRARKFTRNWNGGFWSLECTNEGRGWHLHLHALIDAQWIDAPQLAREWHDVTHWAGMIVKVKDARRQDYLAEICKYVVKGNQLAAWPPDQIRTFIEAFDGLRTFGVFGTLHGKRTQFADWIKTLRDAKPRCPCGSCNVRYMSESESLMLDLVPDQPASTRPPPEPNPEPELAIYVPQNWTP